MENKHEIHFEGDEEWSLINPRSKEVFFYGWFKNKLGTALEAGCGIGNFVVELCKMGFSTTGIEYSPERADMAKKNCKKYGVNAKIISGDIRKMPFKDEMFDVVFSHGVVEHMPDTSNALNELNRVMKPDGVAMISVPNRITFYTLNKLLQKLIGKLTKKRIWRCGYEKSFTPHKFKKLLRESGFCVLEERVSQCSPGKRFPIVGKTLNVLDKPLLPFGHGGHFILFKCAKA